MNDRHILLQIICIYAYTYIYICVGIIYCFQHFYPIEWQYIFIHSNMTMSVRQNELYDVMRSWDLDKLQHHK